MRDENDERVTLGLVVLILCWACVAWAVVVFFAALVYRLTS